MTITERAAYIKGLAEGLGIDDSTKEGKVLNALISAFDDLALTVADLEAEVDELTEEVDAIDEDLGSLEEDYSDEDLYEVCCPTCGDVVCIDSTMLQEGQTTCPNCGELLEFDLEDEDDGQGVGQEEKDQ